MLRDTLSFGRSVALKSVCLSVDVFAAYTSPNPLPVAMTAGGFAALICLLPVPPLLAETSASASAAPSTKSASTPAFRERFPGTSDSFRPSIVPPLPACLSS